MNDDWRLEVDFDDPRHIGALAERLEAGELEHDLSGAFHDRVVVSREGSTVFLYAGSREQAEAARSHVLSLAQQHGWKLDAELTRWGARRRRNGRTPTFRFRVAMRPSRPSTRP